MKLWSVIRQREQNLFFGHVTYFWLFIELYELKWSTGHAISDEVF